jgi:hypothetical protein
VRIYARLVLVLAALLPAPRLIGQTEPIPSGRSPQWGLAAGYGFTWHLNRGRSNEHVLLFVPAVGFRVSSRLEYILEAHLAQYFTPSGTTFGVMPLGGRLFLGSGRMLPYVSIGGGFGWTNLEIEEIDRRFNFLLQGSVGVRRALSEADALTLEARLSHISNGGTKSPNLGLNCLVVLAGWRFR